jgi:hypothetical protein
MNLNQSILEEIIESERTLALAGDRRCQSHLSQRAHGNLGEYCGDSCKEPALANHPRLREAISGGTLRCCICRRLRLQWRRCGRR